jgi:hypothetical protein
MRKGFGEAVLSVGTITVVLLILIGMDANVRSEFSMRFLSNPGQQLQSAGHSASALTSVIARAAHDQSIAHAPMLIFALAATVLVLFMLRT